MNSKTLLAALCVPALAAAATSALIAPLPILSNFDLDPIGPPPLLGGPNQPDTLVTPPGGSIAVVPAALGLGDKPVVLSDDNGEYVSVGYSFPPSVGCVRFEATVSFADQVTGYFMQTIAPGNVVLARLSMNFQGEIFAGGAEVGQFTPSTPQRFRIDTDMVSNTWSVAIDDELDVFADDPTTSGLAFLNPGQLEVIAALASLNASGTASTSIAYDDIYIGNTAIGSAYCFGDGSGNPCPCGNVSGAGVGCTNSTGVGGLLTLDGSTSATLDDVIFYGSQLRPNQPALVYSANFPIVNGAVFGDGLRCGNVNVIRLQTSTVEAAGDIHFGPGLGAVGGWSAGQTRRMQIWYRDPVGPCGSGFNTTNAVELLFTL